MMTRKRSPGTRARRGTVAACVLALAASPIALTSDDRSGGASGVAFAASAPRPPRAPRAPKPSKADREVTFNLEEATFDDIQDAMDAGALTSVELVSMYLNRIAVYDQNGIFLNSTPVINPQALADAAEADALRAEGVVLSALHGVPFSVKDTFSIAGMPTAGGSPALLDLYASEDALIVERLKAAGAVALGKANLPPMGNGTSERSVYGAGKNPYNFEATTDGSSYGSAIGVAANLVAFSFGGDTTGSIRLPSSAQNVVGLKPSKALFPATGTWPLGWQQDVIGPMTRTVQDLAIIADLTVEDYPASIANLEPLFYAPPSTFRPESYEALLDENAFRGKRVGVPKPFIGADFTGTSNYDIGPRVEALLRQAMADMEALGAEVVEIDWPAFHTFARDNAAGMAGDGRRLTPALEAFSFGSPSMNNRVRAYYGDEFIKTFHHPVLTTFGVVAQDTDVITYSTNSSWLQRRQEVRDGIMLPPNVDVGGKPFGTGLLEGYDMWLKRDITDPMDAAGIDVVVFPVRNNVTPLVAGETTQQYPTTGNFGSQASSLGLPGLVVPMGFVAETGVPVGLTFLGKSRNTEADLFPYAYAYEQATKHRTAPAVAPPLPGESITYKALRKPKNDSIPPVVSISTAATIVGSGKKAALQLRGVSTDASGQVNVKVFVNGHKIPSTKGLRWEAEVKLTDLQKWTRPGDAAITVLVLATDSSGNSSATQKSVTLPAV
jgi:amidase